MVGWRRARRASRYGGTRARPPAEIIGVSGDPRHDLASGGTGLYEFWTDEGVPVQLHEADLVSLELRPIDRVLNLRFEYVEARWTPPEAAATPVVAMRFEGVAIREWEHDDVSAGRDGTPAGAYGQVEDFQYDNGETFQLTTYSFAVEFTAARLTVAAEPRR